jgi:hypothetical protein
MQDGRPHPAEQGEPRREATNAETQELRVLLDEAEAARAKLTAKTDELEQRLILLETIMIHSADPATTAETLARC